MKKLKKKLKIKIYKYYLEILYCINKMRDAIIVSFGFFGSVYLFSKSLDITNNMLLSNIKIPLSMILINSSTFILSSLTILFSLSILKDLLCY